MAAAKKATAGGTPPVFAMKRSATIEELANVFVRNPNFTEARRVIFGMDEPGWTGIFQNHHRMVEYVRYILHEKDRAVILERNRARVADREREQEEEDDAASNASDSDDGSDSGEQELLQGLIDDLMLADQNGEWQPEEGSLEEGDERQPERVPQQAEEIFRADLGVV